MDMRDDSLLRLRSGQSVVSASVLSAASGQQQPQPQRAGAGRGQSTGRERLTFPVTPSPQATRTQSYSLRDTQHDGKHPRDLYPRLCDILDRLDNSVKENTACLKSLKSEDKPNDSDEEGHKEDTLIPVQVKVTFLRIIDVDTKNQDYTAEIFLQAKWEEPKIKSFQQKELDLLKWDEYWDPKMAITNIDGEPDEDQVWRRARIDHTSGKPVMVYRRRLRCKLKEKLELEDFPVDIQELTIQVSTERNTREVDLIEDTHEISTVGGFADQQEWELFNFVHIIKKESESNNAMSANKGKHSKLDCMCYVARRPAYFFWNVILIMLLINLLTFTSFAISADKPQSRLGVTLTLLLTAVAFKFVVNDSLPKISYLTHLDIYVLSGMMFLCLQAIQNAVVSVYAGRADSQDQAARVDLFFMIACVVILVFFNVIFFVRLFYKAKKKTIEESNNESKSLQKRKNFMLTELEKPLASVTPRQITPEKSTQTQEMGFAGGVEEARSRRLAIQVPQTYSWIADDKQTFIVKPDSEEEGDAKDKGQKDKRKRRKKIKKKKQNFVDVESQNMDTGSA